MRIFDIWDVIIWISLIVLVAYIVAKLTGLINTPEWVNLIPIITLVFFAEAFYQKVLGFTDRMLVRTNYFKKNIDKINERLIEHDRRLYVLEHSKLKSLSNYLKISPFS